MAQVVKPAVEPLEVTLKAASEEFTLPESEWLIFPPFPPAPPGIKLIPFSDFQNGGVYLIDEDGKKKDSSSLSTDSDHDDETDDLVEHDSNDVPLVTLGVAHDPASKEARAKAKWEARNLKKRIIYRLGYDDCWKIGSGESDWVEPEGTSQHIYDLSTPPFDRLLLATRDFLLSRHEAFQNPINKLMFDNLRSALNIRSDFPGQHWPAPNFVGDEPKEHANEEDKDGEDYAPIPEEICILLRDPVTSIRGHLALARKEAEATWILDRALVLADIVSAYMSYLHHYNVLPDPKINPAFLQALKLARGAKTALVQADKLEQTLNDINGFNMLAWSVWARAKEMGAVQEGMEKLQVTLLEDADGWDVTASEGGPPKGMAVPSPLSASEATPLITSMIYPTPPSALKLHHQIPFARRIIKSVQPPLTVLPPKAPHFQSQLSRLVTAPAPWTPEEKWRQRRPRLTTVEEDDDADEVVFEDPEIGPLEMVIWVERNALPDNVVDLVGMGLRGAWSLVGDDSGHEFWIYRAKDFILPNYWQSTHMTAQTAKDLASKVGV